MTTDRTAWLEARKKGLGGSDIAAILGLSKWRSPMDVWADKRGLTDPIDENPAMVRGRILEPAIADWYAETTNSKVIEGPEMPVAGPHEWMLASPDRYVLSGGNRFGLEIKTARSARDWGDEGSDNIPVYYATQVAWYMACTDADRWDVATLFMINDEFRTYTLNRDKTVEDRLVEVCGDWWETHMIKGEPPTIDGSNAAAKYLLEKYPQPSDTIRRANHEEEALVMKLHEIKQQMKDLQEEKASLENMIKDAIGEDDGIDGNWGKITWRLQKGRQTLDTKRLREKLPEVAEEYTKVGEAIRILRASIQHT
jgi:putative phage-type endonuclease